MAKTKNAAAGSAKPATKSKTAVTAEAKKKPNWTVQEALEDCQAAVRRGSGLRLRPSAEKALFDYYRPGFEYQHSRHGDWHAARERIMMLSQFVGALACILTILKDFLNKRSAPVAVDAKSAIQAAKIVAVISSSSVVNELYDPIILCPQGGWCPDKPLLSDILGEILTQDVATLLPADRLSSIQSAQLENIWNILKDGLDNGR